MTDIQIAQQAAPLPIGDIAAACGIDPQYLEQYGRYKAKIDYRLLRDRADRPDGKLILVTAITPTPAGEGKTTTTVGLTDGLRKIGKNAVAALPAGPLPPAAVSRRRVSKCTPCTTARVMVCAAGSAW
jgi:formate--tetrahydrofolate ligase